MDEVVFTPLGLEDTRVWTALDGPRPSGLAGTFRWSGEGAEALEPAAWDGLAGDGGVFSSIHDFQRWMALWNGDGLLSPDLLTLATTPAQLADGPAPQGMGWGVADAFHVANGSWLGARTFMLRSPTSGFSVVVLCNSSDDADEVAEAVLTPLLTLRPPGQ